jgi:RES domain-containing protein
LKALSRGGHYFRVFKPDWDDPLDTKPNRERGGRWNAPGTFGALYLNATPAVAAANARRQHAGRAIGLFDLRPERRPSLLTVDVPRGLHADVVTIDGIKMLRLPANYPWNVDHERCRPIGKRAYAEARLRGVACRSAAECTATEWLGEELAWFDRSKKLDAVERRAFTKWYPDPYPA